MINLTKAKAIMGMHFHLIWPTLKVMLTFNVLNVGTAEITSGADH